MFGNLPTYPDMRPSGLSWAESLPAHWRLQRAKQIMKAIDFRSADGDEELLTVSSRHGVIPRSTATVSMFKAETYVGHKLCWPDDLVINSLWAWGRGLGVARHHGIVSTAYGVYRQRNSELDPAYLHHLVRSDPFQWELQVRSQGVWKSRLQITDQRWLDAPMLVPPKDEQAAIVKYLAHANARIDKTIAAKRRLIELLQEQRARTVDDLVTGRDKPLQSVSRLPWLESVPEGWEWRRFRTITRFITSGSRGWAEYYADQGAIFLQSGNLGRQLDLKLSNLQRVDLPESASEGIRTRVQPRDLLMCITGALTGNVSMVPDDWTAEAYVNQHIALIRPAHNAVDAEFLGLAMKSRSSQIQFRASEYGGTKQGLGLDEVKNLEVLMPSLTEQRTTIARIADRTARLDRAIESNGNEIALLREFRTRLVADVVTGQVDVGPIAAKLPDAPESFDNAIVELDDDLEEALVGSEE